MTLPMNTSDRPVGALDAESVKLLRMGDLLVSANNKLGTLLAAQHGMIAVEKQSSVLGGITITDAYSPDHWSFLGRPDADGWIEHHGGENPAPGMRVEYKMRGHRDEGPFGPDASDECTWGWSEEDHDIIAWRPHVSPQPSPPIQGAVEPHCQLCGGEVQGWTCQTCEADFEEVDGLLILKSDNAHAALLSRIAVLEGALGTLVERLETIHQDPKYIAVWTMYQMHCGPYRGPQYDSELAEARSALQTQEG